MGPADRREGEVTETTPVKDAYDAAGLARLAQLEQERERILDALGGLSARIIEIQFALGVKRERPRGRQPGMGLIMRIRRATVLGILGVRPCGVIFLARVLECSKQNMHAVLVGLKDDGLIIKDGIKWRKV